MNDKIERKLARDAHALETLTVSEDARDALDARLAMTRQAAAEAAEPPRPLWQPAALAATVFLSVIIGLIITSGSPDSDGESTIAETTVPVRETESSPATQRFEKLPIQTVSEAVSQATPLENEWVALRDDLERAKEKIEADLPVRF
ncbi:MAG: hypothetical protein AAGM16_13660 [Pseudomonadota bacterium]